MAWGEKVSELYHCDKNNLTIPHNKRTAFTFKDQLEGNYLKAKNAEWPFPSTHL